MEIKPILLTVKQNKAIALLIITQVAITLSVLSVSLLMTLTTLKEWNLPSGLPHENLISVVPQFFDDSIDVKQSYVDDIRLIREIPGVVSVSAISEVPFAARGYSEFTLSLEEGAQVYQTNYFSGDINMKEVLDIQTIEGRYFTQDEVFIGHEDERQDIPPVVSVSEDLAKELFGDESALGQTIWVNAEQSVQIVGVHSNFMNGENLNYVGKSYHTILSPNVTWSSGQDPKYIIRTEPGLAPSLLEDINAAIYKTDGRYIQASEVLTRTQKRMYDGRGSRAVMLLSISLILLLITAFGMAGLVSFLVTQRQRQIGTRRALGATKWDVVRYFMLENVILSVIGVVIGVCLSIWFTILLIDDTGLDIMNINTIFGTALFICIVNQIAVYLPAKRAANVAPAIVTRSS